MTKPGRADTRNIDPATVRGFGDEWTAFDQRTLPAGEQEDIFAAYFALFPWDRLAENAEGFDLGCGSGRWAALVAPRVGRLHCIDASEAALAVARHRLQSEKNVTFHLASVDDIPLADASQSFGYCLGVLHHVPDPSQGLAACVRKLKPGAPFLLYLYYRFDNRPVWYRLLWRLSDVFRRAVSGLPFGLRRSITDAIAVLIYWPLASCARVGERLGLNVELWPLSAYRHRSLYTLRTDALDRFGTALEHRFTRAEIEEMMQGAGLERIEFSTHVPHWVALGWRRTG